MEIATEKEDKKLADLKEVTCNFEDGFDTVNMFLRLAGLNNVFREKKSGSKIFRIFQWTLYISAYILTAIYIILEFIHYYRSLMSSSNDNFLAVFGMIPCTCVCIFGLLKSAILIMKGMKISKLVDSLKTMWPDMENLEVKQIVVDNMVTTKKYIFFYMMQINILASMWSVIPVSIIIYNVSMKLLGLSTRRWSENADLPYVMWHPYDTHANFFIFLATFIPQTYDGIYVCSLMAATDCLFCVLVSHVCMHLQLMKRELTLLTYKDSEEAIKTIVKKHNKLFSYVKEIEEIFSFQLFFNLLGSTVLICMQLFCVTIAPKDAAFKYALFVFTALSQISLICFYGNKLTEESLAMRFSAYSAGWVDGSQSLKMSILMIQMRSLYPTAISAMGFMNVNMDTFASILSTSWSYFMLLHNMYQETEI
ncbi:odorant receptor 67c-like [Arctopsyche grandis]|uniref:odorant receptor 67c-like n=1 Tax=Arctopsyche grandis TaxID=121162 RepID=UPI00406D7F18